MGSSGSKYVIALGFIVIFFGMFFQTWMHASPEQQQAHLAVLRAEIAAKQLPPSRPPVREWKMPEEKAMRAQLGVKDGEEEKGDYKDNFKKWYEEAEKRVREDAGKRYNDDVFVKTQKGSAGWQKRYLEDYANYMVDSLNYEYDRYEWDKRVKNAELRVAEEAAENGWGQWFWGIIIYFGVVIAGIGFIMLSISGEGNEKLGALICLGLLPIFIVLFLYGINGV